MKTRIILLLLVVLAVLPAAAYEPADNAGLSKKEQRSTLRGYNCFVDMGPSFDIDGKTSDWFNSDFLSVSTTHGYQFNDFFFLGGGIAFGVCPEFDMFQMPIFAECRVNFLDRRVTPYFLCRIGSSFVDPHNVSAYEAFLLGLRISLTEKTALFFSAGIEVNLETDDCDAGGYSFRIGYEF